MFKSLVKAVVIAEAIELCAAIACIPTPAYAASGGFVLQGTPTTGAPTNPKCLKFETTTNGTSSDDSPAIVYMYSSQDDNSAITSTWITTSRLTQLPIFFYSGLGSGGGCNVSPTVYHGSDCPAEDSTHEYICRLAF